ncbi:hypothetical protein SpCBS45565_g02367 [Spizellomyces sp. 'palustris']|nr:hypothetical protein SpCBS45565_g02367 [Spizellomyces sp. 'palustris']
MKVPLKLLKFAQRCRWLAKQASSRQRNETDIRQILVRCARRYPGRGLYYVASVSGIENPTFTTYMELLNRAVLISSALKAKGLSQGRVIVLYFSNHQDNIEYFWGALFAGLLPCVLGPLNPSVPGKNSKMVSYLHRLLNKPVFLTRQSQCQDLSNVNEEDTLEILTADELESKAVMTKRTTSHRQHGGSPYDTTLLLLTSGSTGMPKAVELTHGNVFAASQAKAATYNLTGDDTVLNWVGFDHVACAVENHITPMCVGANQVHVLAPLLLNDVGSFFKMIEHHGITLTFAPNFLLAKMNSCLRENMEQYRGKLNLSNLRRINSGGEANVVETGQQLLEALEKADTGFSGCITPGFGMTETCAGCIYNVGYPLVDAGRELASVGRCVKSAQMRIVDKDGKETSSGSVGALQIRGRMVFKGYFNNPVATRESFTDGWFKTGDCGFVVDGVLTLTGRANDSIIVNGINYGTSELERLLENVPGITKSFVAVFTTRPPGSGHEHLAIVYLPSFAYPDDEETLVKTHAAIRERTVLYCSKVPDLILPLPQKSMEKTSLGKLPRGQLRKQLEGGGFDRHLSKVEEIFAKRRQGLKASPVTPAENMLATFWSQIFGVPEESLDAEENFFERGGSSLEVIRYKSMIVEHFSLEDNWPVIRIMQYPTIRSLAHHLTSETQLAENVNPNSNYDPLICLQPTGSRTPVFFIHPGVGEVLIFVNLAKYFIGERPFYALRARGFDEGQTYFESMEEMVETYTRAIERKQPHGPYALAGYSYGGIVAFEIAKKLEARNAEVKFVGLVNIPPHIKSRMLEINWTDGFLNLSYFLEFITKPEAIELASQLLPLSRREQLDYVWHRAPKARRAELGLDVERLEKWVDLAQSLLACGRAYEPSGMVRGCDLTVFYAEPLKGTKTDWLVNQLQDWTKYAHRNVQYVDVPGSHYTLMNQVYVAHFQKIFKDSLANAGL